MSILDRGLDILELLVRHDEGLPLTAIAQQLDIPKSGAHRLLANLVKRRYVRQDAKTQNYVLTLHLAALGFEFLEACRIPDICQPELDRLAMLSGELVRLAVAEKDGLTWVARAQGAHFGLRYVPEMDIRPVLHATAVGKMWLSTLPQDEALRLALSNPGFGQPGRFGPRANRTIAELVTSLAEIRAAGNAMVVEEGAAGTAAMAIAIRAGTDPDAPVVGTVSIAGPSVRHTIERMHALLPALAEAAQTLSRLWPMRRYTLASGSAESIGEPVPP